ncbi:hypothetical protein E2C01_077758 [Portunus trituberculatus]|uniref:Uncharacterized protein n=1 Tax=Portunus trituberculatus TaxID=210409 RepID=A0A5B7IQK7_PORTR|nr:hypothetical protein [Portunus trituberculatus]
MKSLVTLQWLRTKMLSLRGNRGVCGINLSGRVPLVPEPRQSSTVSLLSGL